ncbi:hypothetical protein PTKU64_88850 [Paraburkholderia terrae]|uniref:Uncharacterized protein n=1 Tax=Paraburkholderia terrae TaxID=311230 RepID=A0ABN6JWM3_9BURK|nr:hypothetical protein PTKU64_88850 [Paraburkholderia terrae]
MLQAGDGVEEGGDLLQAEDDGEPDWLPGQGEILVTPVKFERHAVEEAQRADRRAETAFRRSPELLGPEEIRAWLIYGCQLALVAEVVVPCETRCNR